jgi:outer membrane protein assembly factor BamB
MKRIFAMFKVLGNRGKVGAGLCALFLSGAMARLEAGDWPQFMGPNGDGTSAEKGLMRAWPEGGPIVLWTAKMGSGYGCPAVRDGKALLLDRIEQKQDVLRCLDLLTGKEEWTFAYDAPGRISHEGSRSTPAISDKFIFTIGPFGHLHCLDRASHQVVWKSNILSDYQTKLPMWAVSQSPLLYKDMVIVAPQSSEVGILALDQATGKERWHSGPVGPLAYASPRLITVDGVEQISIVTPVGATAVDAKDGKTLWSFNHECKIPIPNLSALGDGKFFITGAYNAGSAIFRVTRQGDQWKAKNIAKIDKMGGHCHPGLVYQDHIYVLCNTNERADGLVCLDFTGKIIWKTEKNPYLDKGGSILTGDGLIYLVDGKMGDLHIIDPSPAGFKSLAKVKLLAGQEIWGPLALADGKLIIRDQSQMKCLEIKAR